MGNNNCCVKNSDNSDGDDEDDGQLPLASCRVLRPPSNLRASNPNMVRRHQDADFASVSKLRSSAMLPPLSMSKKLQLPKTPLKQQQPARSNTVLMQQLNNLWVEQSNKEVMNF